MRPLHFEYVLWLSIAACSAQPEQIVLPALDPRSQFDNPGTAPVTTDAAVPEGGFGEDSCASGLIEVPRVPPRVVLVLDGSCSMSTDYPANGAESATQCSRNTRGRWAALRNALIGQDGVVPKLEKLVAFGLAVYGTQPSCPIPGNAVSPDLDNLARIRSGLPQIQPGMYTPTGPALDWVYRNLIRVQAPDQRGAAQIVILATDGEPNSCGASGGGFGFGRATDTETNYQPSIDAVKRGAMRGATTYVISLADATGPFHDHLQELARLGNPGAGDEAKLFEPSSPDQLAQTLETIARAAVSCDIELNGTILIDQACEGVVKLDGSMLTCDDPNGWKALDERNIRLQGSACDQLMSNNDAIIETDFSCSGFRPG